MRGSGLWKGGSPGRPRGSPNKSTAKVKAFLAGVFTEAFESPELHERLVRQIVSLEIDPRLLALLLQYYAGRPPMAVDHHVQGTLSLAELIVGVAHAEDDES